MADMCQTTAPTVIIAGSCSWPPFRQIASDLVLLRHRLLAAANDLSSAVNFSLIYIAEAQAADERPIHSSRCTPDGLPVEIVQPKVLDERIQVANQFVQDYGLQEFPLFVDDPSAGKIIEKLYVCMYVCIYIVCQQDQQCLSICM